MRRGRCHNSRTAPERNKGMHGRKDLMTRTILRSLFNRLGNTAVKWAACLLATVCISSAWGATTVAKIGDTEYRSLQDAVNKVTNGQTIRLVADCDEPVLVARDVSFSIVPDSGIAFTGSIEKGSDDTAITATDGENGAKSYMVVLQDLKYPWTTEGQAQLQACIKKAWEKPQEGLYIAGRKIRKSGRYDGEGYSDVEGPITVDLENHTIALNSATITVNSSPVQTYVKTSTASASNGRSENVVDNSVPYEGVVCLNEVSYAHPGSGRNDNTTRDYYWWLLGYNMASDNMATAGIAILDDNAWTLTLVGENKIQVNAAFSYPSGSYTTAGCAYGIYAKGNLTVVKGNGESVGNLVADITNNGTGNYQSANYYPGNSAVCSMGNLTISEGTAIFAVLDGTMTATVNGAEYTTQNFAKYGAIYAATNVTISGATVAATNKLVSSAAGYGNGVSAIGSRYGNITIDGSAVDAVCLGQYQALVSGEMVTAYRGQGISTYGAYGAYTTVEIKGGADVNIEAGFSGIDGNGGVTISGQGTVVDVDVVGDGNGIAASQGTYQISEASVTVNAAVAVAQNYKTGSIISTGDYSSSVPANAVAANTYQYYQNGMYHLTDTIPTGWVAYYDGTFYMDHGSSAEAIALCGEGKSVYINEDSSAAKTGIGEGRNFTVYVLEGKSYTGAVTSERLVSNLTTGDATEFDGKTYVPNTFTMSVDPEHAVAKIVEADGATTYYASMATSYSSPRYTGAASSLKAGDTLVILEDVALASSLSKSINWTLDLNGCKVTCGSNYYVSQSTANYTLTIKDSSAAQTGVIHQTYVPANNSSAGSGVRCSNGTIVIESGRFTGGNTPVVATGSGVIEIRGGYFDGALYVATYSPGTYVCYGGTYTVDPVKHVAEGYAAAKTVVNETDLWIVGRLDMTTSVNATSDTSAEYVISASIYDADDNLIAKLAEDQTIAVSIDTIKDVTGSTLAKFDAEKVVTTALLNAEDSSKITAIAISVQSAMTNNVDTINNSTKERTGTGVYYDVKPVAEVVAAGAENTAFTIANDAIADGAEFAFDLVLPEIDGVEAGTVLTVTHISAGYNNETTYDIAKADSNGGLYVSAATTHFSTFRVNYSTQSATAKLLTVSGNADFISTSYLETDIATAVSKVGQKGTVGKVVLLSDFTLNESVSVTKPVASETIVDLNGHTITLAEGVENAFVISGEGTMLTVKNGTASVGISGYPENYAVVATTVDGATTYTAAPAVAQVEIAGVVTKYADLHAALEAGKAAGSVVTLLADVDLAGVAWEPVLNFAGTFDGGSKVISNLTTGGADQDHCGLFGNTTNSKSFICNVVVSNATVTARKWAAAVVGELASSSTISNITVKGLVQITGNTFVGGIVGQGYAYFRDSRIAGDEGSFVKGVWIGDNLEGDNVGGIIGHLGEGGGLGLYDCSASGLNITGTRKIGGMVGTFSHSSQISNVAVSDVMLGTTATLEYANANKSTMHLGGIVGSYFGSATTGTISGTAEDVTILVDEFAEGISYEAGNVNYGLVAGGSRVPSDKNPEAYVADWSGVVAMGYDAAKYSNAYLIPKVAQIGDAKYVTFADAIAAAEAYYAENGTYPEIAVLDATAEQSNPDWKIADGYLVKKTYVAQIGANKYESLADAIADAQTGDTVQLLTDVSATAVVEITKSIILDGNGHNLNTSATRAIWIDAGNVDVTVKNLTILANANLERAIQVNNNCNNVTLTIDTVTATATYYAINVCNGASNLGLTITNSTITGWSAVNAWGSNGNISIVDSELTGLNNKSYHQSNSFGVIVIEGDTTGQTDMAADTITVLVKNTTITSKSTTGNKQYVILYNNPNVNNAITLEECAIVLDGDETSFFNDSGTGNTTKIKNTYLTGTETKPALPDLYEYEELEDDYFLITFDPEVFYYWDQNGGYAGTYAAFAQPFSEGWLMDGEYIALQKDVTLSSDIEYSTSDGTIATTGGRFTLTFGDYSITKGDYTFVIPKGVSITTDKRVTDLFDAPAWYYEIKETANGDGTYTYSIYIPEYTITYTGEAPDGVDDFNLPQATTYTNSLTSTILPLPTYTATGTAFAGWKVKDSDPEVILSAIPAGATTDYELVATWTGVKTVTVDAGESKTPTIKVTDDWIAQNVTNEVSEATTEKIQTALETEDDNGLKKWQNYVLGQSPTAKFSANALQGSIEAMPVKSSAQTPVVDTGFKVQYRLDKVTAAGATEAAGTAQDSTVIPLDLSGMDGAVAYYKTTAVITATDGLSVSVDVPATNTIGVLKVASAPKTAMIAVPWASLDGDGAISAANLVRTANLTVGDELHYYTNGKFQSWTLGANGTWQSTKNVSDSGTTDGDAASDAKIPRGSAVWLKRQDASKPVYLVGEVGTGTAKTALEGGSENAPAWNMVASPSVEAVDVTKKVDAVVGDRIVIPTDGAPKNYTFKDGKWGYNKTEKVTINGQVGIRSVRVVVDALESTPGVGFWYLNAGAEKDVDWTSEDDQGADAD